MKLRITHIAAAVGLAAVTVTGIAVAQDRGRDGDRDGQRFAHNRSEAGHHRMGHRDRAMRAGLTRLIELYDTNEDGSITQEEIDATRTARLQEFDADGNGTLDLSEYEALWLDAMRERMVDRFQAHDDDGDGAVTVEEFGEEQANIVARRDRNEDGALSIDDIRRGGDRRPRSPDAE